MASNCQQDNTPNTPANGDGRLETYMMLTIKQTCERLAIGRSHLWCLVRSGKIRTVRIGKRGIRVPESEIDRFIRDGLKESSWEHSNDLEY